MLGKYEQLRNAVGGFKKSNILEEFKQDLKTGYMRSWSKYKPAVFRYKGKYVDNWFSNMVPVKLEFRNNTYNSVEGFYQSMKELNTINHIVMSSMSPYDVKKAGRGVENPFEYLLDDENIKVIFETDIKPITLPYDNLSCIDEVKLTIMYVGLMTKFSIKEWKDKLLKTDNIIVEWNNWGDTFWGADIKRGKGHNWLGRLLMKIREDFKKENDVST